MHIYWRLTLVTLVLSIGGFLLFIAGCENDPPAQKPQYLVVIALLHPDPAINPSLAWSSVGANYDGQYEILPGERPGVGVKLSFCAPWPGALHVAIDGTDLPKFEDVAQGTNPADTGYYRVENINPNPIPPRWDIRVRPPNGKLMSTTYSIGVSSVSINPKYAVGSADHESAPLVIAAVRQRIATLTVSNQGSGRGMVTSSAIAASIPPMQINCGLDCTVYTTQALYYQLYHIEASGSSFGGWSGACSGTGTCIVAMVPSTPTALVVVATFNRDSAGSSQLGNCPHVALIDGYTFVGEPGCATHLIDEHPSAILACDSQGYYCCELSQGSNDPKCGAGHRQFPPDCMAWGRKAQLMQPYGCYERDGLP